MKHTASMLLVLAAALTLAALPGCHGHAYLMVSVNFIAPLLP